MWSVKCGVESGECELLSLKGGVWSVWSAWSLWNAWSVWIVWSVWSVERGV